MHCQSAPATVLTAGIRKVVPLATPNAPVGLPVAAALESTQLALLSIQPAGSVSCTSVSVLLDARDTVEPLTDTTGVAVLTIQLLSVLVSKRGLTFTG